MRDELHAQLVRPQVPGDEVLQEVAVHLGVWISSASLELGWFGG